VQLIFDISFVTTTFSDLSRHPPPQWRPIYAGQLMLDPKCKFPNNFRLTAHNDVIIIHHHHISCSYSRKYSNNNNNNNKKKSNFDQMLLSGFWWIDRPDVFMVQQNTEG
jgi:hypothetical protein